MAMSLIDGFNAAIKKAVKKQQDLIEVACEKSLQGGEHGVLVVEDLGRLAYAEPSELVPFGYIYRVPLAGLGNFLKQQIETA